MPRNYFSSCLWVWPVSSFCDPVKAEVSVGWWDNGEAGGWVNFQWYSLLAISSIHISINPWGRNQQAKEGHSWMRPQRPHSTKSFWSKKTEAKTLRESVQGLYALISRVQTRVCSPFSQVNNTCQQALSFMTLSYVEVMQQDEHNRRSTLGKY